MLLNNKGFTLLENLVAASILAIAVISLLQLFSINLRSLSYSEDYIRAQLRADEIMKEIDLTKDLTETIQTIKDPDGMSIVWETRKVDTERTKDIPLELFEIKVKVKWEKYSKQRSITLTTYKTVAKKL